VPVAIYYRDVNDFPSDAYVTFGQPIEVSEYKTLYSESPNLAINQLRKDLETRLKSMVVDIWNDEFYDDYCLAIDWNGDRIAKNNSVVERRLPSGIAPYREGAGSPFELDPERFQQKIDELRERNSCCRKTDSPPKTGYGSGLQMEPLRPFFGTSPYRPHRAVRLLEWPLPRC